MSNIGSAGMALIFNQETIFYPIDVDSKSQHCRVLEASTLTKDKSDRQKGNKEQKGDRNKSGTLTWL